MAIRAGRPRRGREKKRRRPNTSTRRPLGRPKAWSGPPDALPPLVRSWCVSAAREGSSPGDRGEAPELTPPEEGYMLYRHKNEGETRTRNWHRLYWARRNEEGDYEIRSVPTSQGEPSAPGGTFPRDSF